MKLKILILGTILLSLNGFSQDSEYTSYNSLSLYSNFQWNREFNSIFLSDSTELNVHNSTNLGGLSFGYRTKIKENLFKEFFFQNINFLTVEDLSLPVQIDSITFQNTGGFRKTTSSATMGLEISKKFFSTKNEKLDFLLGASGQIGYHLASYKPKASVFNPHKFFNLFGQINLVPRVSNVINERLSLNVSCFIPVLNIESNRTTIDNPRIPVNQRSQTQINLDIISYFNHLRFGLVYKLAPKK